MNRTELLKINFDYPQEKRKRNSKDLPGGLKYALSALSGGLVSAGAIFAWGLSGSFVTNESQPLKEEQPLPDDVVEDDVTVKLEKQSLSKFDKVFAEARLENGPGSVFEYNGNYYGTYYKEEWDAMSVEDKKQYYASVDEKILEIKEVQSTTNEVDASTHRETFKMATMVTDEMDEEMAFHVARSEVGPGQLYFYQGEVFSTYTVDELLALTPDELSRMQQIVEQATVSEPYIEQMDGYEEIILDQNMLQASLESLDEIEISSDDQDFSEPIMMIEEADSPEIVLEKQFVEIEPELESESPVVDSVLSDDSTTLDDLNIDPSAFDGIDFVADPPFPNSQ